MSLVEQLSHKSSGVKFPVCALTKAKPCCRGSGVVIRPKDAFTVAEVCSCVKACAVCFGQCRLMFEDKASRLCREPSPIKISRLVNGAAIPSRYYHASLLDFANFSGNGREIVDRIKSWQLAFQPNEGKGFILSGPIGVGKTYLLAAVVKSLALRGMSVVFVDFFQLLSILKAGYSEDRSDLEVLTPLIRADLLVIDELGKGRNTEWELTILDQLIMGRYNQNKVFVASTNYSFSSVDPLQQEVRPSSSSFYQPQEEKFLNRSFDPLLTRIGTRIYSRFKEMTDFWTIEGVDFREG